MSQQGGKVGVVTGAGQGLGRAIALAFSKAGYDIALVGRTEGKLRDTAALLPGSSAVVVADLIDPNQVRTAFAQIDAELGGVDVLINNAASYAAFPIDKATDAQIDGVVYQSLISPIYCIREAVPRMKVRGAGDIVNISTQSVDTPQPYMIVYGAAKAGLEALSRGLRYELRGTPIRTVVVQLGAIAGTVPDDEWMAQQVPFGIALQRAGLGNTFIMPGSEPDTIAATVLHAVQAPRETQLETIVIRGMDSAGQ